MEVGLADPPGVGRTLSPLLLLSKFHYDHNRAQFYVEDATTASALKQVSRKITDRDNYKVRASICVGAALQSGRSRST